MALLSSNELAKLRQECSKGVKVNYLKEDINSSLQAIENWFDKSSVKQSLSNDIDASTSFSFTNVQKKQLVKYWLQDRFGRE